MSVLPATSPATLGLPERRSLVLERSFGGQLAGSVAVVGLGYVGLPTAIMLADVGFAVVGVDVSAARLRDIRELREVDLPAGERLTLADVLEREALVLTSSVSGLADADAVIICVPTPIDDRRQPDARLLEQACSTVVDHAHPGQTIILTSTSFVGSTRELLVEPLAQRGLVAGHNVFVAFSPERIDPGSSSSPPPHEVPRVLGASTEACASSAAKVLGETSARLHVVSSAEAAELCKLSENSFRAVNIALANELADASCRLGLDPLEVVAAAATKPFGYMPFYPGPGVGGHCIPCDPYYLLEPLRRLGVAAPVLESAMGSIADRPARVTDRVLELLADAGVGPRGGRVLVVGITYKPGVRDVRASPGVELVHRLHTLGVHVEFHDPLVDALELGPALALLSIQHPAPSDYDLAVITCLQPGHDYAWIEGCARTLDCTYRLPVAPERHLL